VEVVSLMIKMISRGELFKTSENRLVVRPAENFKFKRKILAKVTAEKESDIASEIYYEDYEDKDVNENKDVNDDKDVDENKIVDVNKIVDDDNYKDDNGYKDNSGNNSVRERKLRERKFETEKNREINAENDGAGEKEKNWLTVGTSLLLLIGVEDEAGSPAEDLVIVPAVLEAGPKAAGEELIIPWEKDCEDVRDERERKRKTRPGIKEVEIVVKLKISLEELGLGKPEMKNFNPDKYDSRHPGFKEFDLGNSGFNKSGFEEPAGEEMNLKKKGLKKPGLKLIDVFAEGNGAYYSVFALSQDRIYEIYSDGACRGNPGPGGYAAIVLETGEVLEEISGNSEETTNNRMELLGVIEGLESLAAGSRVRIYTDSSYVLRGMEEWLDNWKNNGWVTSGGKPVKNQDLWKRIAELQEKYRIELIKVKGHSGDKMNNRADQLAKKACQKACKEGL